MKSTIIHKILVVLTVLFLLLPMFQMLTRSFPVQPLHGVFQTQELPELHVKNWFDFEYQPKFHRYLLDNYGFREWAVQIFNQIQFSLFGIGNPNVTYGKEGYLYEPWFIEAYYGRDYIGDSLIASNVEKIKAIRDTLKSLNKDLVIVLTPGKVDYWPEFVPDELKGVQNKTNTLAYAEAFQSAHYPVLDVNTWFAAARDSSRISLFPKTGTHWSVYGAGLAMDSLTKFIGNQTGKCLPEMEFYDVQETTHLDKGDKDIEGLFNLLFPLDRLPLAYPKTRIIAPENAYMPRVSFISDSFFWNIFNFYPLKGKIFDDVSYWYYNNTIYPDAYKKPITTKDLTVEELLSKNDLFVLMACPANVSELGWGFIDRFYSHFYEQKETNAASMEMNRLIEDLQKQILSSEKWTAKIREKAMKKRISFDSMLYLDARWMARKKLESKQ